MSIKTTYNLQGISIVDAIIRIERLWGSSREGWAALVSVNTVTDIPAKDAVGVEGEVGYIPAQPATKQYNKITEFNRHTQYDINERGYASMYKALTAEFGGIAV